MRSWPCFFGRKVYSRLDLCDLLLSQRCVALQLRRSVVELYTSPMSVGIGIISSRLHQEEPTFRVGRVFRANPPMPPKKKLRVRKVSRAQLKSRRKANNPGLRSEAALFSTFVKLKEGSQPTESGTLSIVHSHNHAGDDGYRCFLKYTDSADRKYGAVRLTLLDTLTVFLEKSLSDMLLPGEEARIRALVQGREQLASKPNRWANVGSQSSGAKRGSSSVSKDGVTPGDGLCEITDYQVQWYHQIYGLYRDNKEMSQLFQESSKRWKQTAVANGAEYHLWIADEIDTLVRTHFPQYLDKYTNMRYPVMKGDVGRNLVLFIYGGLYSDLDVWPNRGDYRQARFAVCSVPAGLSANEHAFLDMEVLMSTPGNPILLKWVDYMMSQIDAIDYTLPTSVYKSWRMRYIYQTTGPSAMNRFLNLKEMKNVEVTHISCNRFRDYNKLTWTQRQSYDVLTRISNSYYTDEFEHKTPVCAENVPLPSRDQRQIRLRSKSMVLAPVTFPKMARLNTDLGIGAPSHTPAAHELQVSDLWNALSTEPGEDGVPPNTYGPFGPEGDKPPAGPGGDESPALEQGVETEIPKHIQEKLEQAVAVAVATIKQELKEAKEQAKSFEASFNRTRMEVMTLRGEADQYKDTADLLRQDACLLTTILAYFSERQNCAGVQTLLQDMPEVLRTDILKRLPSHGRAPSRPRWSGLELKAVPMMGNTHRPRVP